MTWGSYLPRDIELSDESKHLMTNPCSRELCRLCTMSDCAVKCTCKRHGAAQHRAKGRHSPFWLQISAHEFVMFNQFKSSKW